MTVWNDYANAIKYGEIPACKRVKQAVERYFSDLNDPRYEFDTATVERFIAFSRLCPHVKGPLRGQPIELEPWQQFAFANLLGFKVRESGRRKYSSAFIEVPRKNAKSTVAAMLANWFLVMEKGQQDIYTAAVSRDQARIVFDDARQMCLLSKPLKKRVNIQAHKVIFPKSNSLLKPLAAKAATIEGTNPSLAIVDEYHLHPDNGVYSALELGMGARPEAILFAITTAGSNVVSACKQHYDYCCQILAGDLNNLTGRLPVGSEYPNSDAASQPPGSHASPSLPSLLIFTSCFHAWLNSSPPSRGGIPSRSRASFGFMIPFLMPRS